MLKRVKYSFLKTMSLLCITSVQWALIGNWLQTQVHDMTRERENHVLYFPKVSLFFFFFLVTWEHIQLKRNKSVNYRTESDLSPTI